MEKRRDQRIHKFLQIQLANTKENVNASTIDISAFGLRARLHQRKVVNPHQRFKVGITDHGRNYAIAGEIRWYRRDVVDNSHYIGIAFPEPDSLFCRDVLKLELGGPTLPYRCCFESQEAFSREYLENIAYGGLLMHWNSELPKLYKNVTVELVVPQKAEPFRVQGEVVAHVPGGFGLKLNEMANCKRRLNQWMNPNSAIAI